MNIFTDGACKENSRKDGVAIGNGGWAYVILKEVPGMDMQVVKSDSGFKKGTTNQQMEIDAVYKAFESLKAGGEVINLYSDSAYVINCLKDKWYVKWRNNGWLNGKKKPVENRESWERMISIVEKHNVNFFHVKRNSTKFIREVDSMAKIASRQEPT